MIENIIISHFPNMPAGQDHYLSEERFGKSCFCPNKHDFHIICLLPVNLQISPYSPDKVSFKEKVNPILSDIALT
jgi:hypothetical protein